MSDERDGAVKRFPLKLSDLKKSPPSPASSSVRRAEAFAPLRPHAVVRAAATVAGTRSAGLTSRSPAVTSTVTSAVSSVATRAGLQGGAGASMILTSDRVRARMVDRVRESGVTHPGVLAAMMTVPRHAFVDAALAPQAYEEAALPIGHHQTISKPCVVARMIEVAMHGRPSLARVLEVGTGCGYQAAVLSQVAQDVFSIERVRPLHERAKRNLRPLRVPNIRLHYGDGRLGLPDSAPFDAIIVAAAGLDIPEALVEQLNIGGRLIAPVGGDSQVLTLVERTGARQWRTTVLDRVFFVPLKSGVI